MSKDFRHITVTIDVSGPNLAEQLAKREILDTTFAPHTDVVAYADPRIRNNKLVIYFASKENKEKFLKRKIYLNDDGITEISTAKPETTTSPKNERETILINIFVPPAFLTVEDLAQALKKDFEEDELIEVTGTHALIHKKVRSHVLYLKAVVKKGVSPKNKILFNEGVNGFNIQSEWAKGTKLHQWKVANQALVNEGKQALPKTAVWGGRREKNTPPNNQNPLGESKERKEKREAEEAKRLQEVEEAKRLQEAEEAKSKKETEEAEDAQKKEAAPQGATNKGSPPKENRQDSTPKPDESSRGRKRPELSDERSQSPNKKLNTAHEDDTDESESPLASGMAELGSDFSLHSDREGEDENVDGDLEEGTEDSSKGMSTTRKMTTHLFTATPISLLKANRFEEDFSHQSDEESGVVSPPQGN